MPSAQPLPAVLPGRFSGADMVATLVVGTAVVISVLWLTDVALTDWSTRVIAGAVLALGWVGCMTARSRMVDVYGAQGHQRAPVAYVVVASLVGAVALISGVIAVVWAVSGMLVVLAAATALLWVIATTRHLTTRRGQYPQHV